VIVEIILIIRYLSESKQYSRNPYAYTFEKTAFVTGRGKS